MIHLRKYIKVLLDSFALKGPHTFQISFTADESYVIELACHADFTLVKNIKHITTIKLAKS